jgi:hypothetical protein
MNADTPEFKQECLRRLVGICLKAIGHLTPPWRGGWHPDFLSLRYKARMPWVFRWLEEELKKRQKDGARFIGRRCRNALIDEIRKHKAEQRRKRLDAGPPQEPLTPEQKQARGIELRQELMAVLGLHMRYSTELNRLDPLERDITFDSIMALAPVKNVELARRYGCSEGQIRKKKKSLFGKLKRSKKARIEHYDRQQMAAMRRNFDGWAKIARKDQAVWWDKKRDGKPFVFTTKKQLYEKRKSYE